MAEMDLLDLRLQRAVQRARERNNGGVDDDFLGLLISDKQIDSILTIGGLNGAVGDTDPLETIILQCKDELAARRVSSIDQGIPLRWEKLRSLFHLCDWEMGVVNICLALDLDLKYEALYAYLQDDAGRKRPTVNLVMMILSDGQTDKVEHRKYLAHSAPLLKHGLLHLSNDPYGENSPLLARQLNLEARVTDYLLGSDVVDLQLEPFVELTQSSATWQDVVLPEETRGRLQRLGETMQDPVSQQPGVLLYLSGPPGTGKRTVSQALCGSFGMKLLAIDCEGLAASDQSGSDLVKLAFREALLQEAVPYWYNFDFLLGDDPLRKSSLANFTQALRGQAGLTILAGKQPWLPQVDLGGQHFLTESLLRPDYRQRKWFWKTRINVYQSNITEQQLTTLAGKFQFSGGQIGQVAATAKDLALWRSGPSADVTAEDLDSASRWHSNQRLKLLAQKISPHYAWDDLVLPEDQKEQLREICGYFMNMSVVYEEWGFQRKTSLGKGLNILFAGPSGTGKTMASEIMAGELGLDIYKIDLSSIVSKYIGETEKNLDRIFQEAQDSNAILFFDEADAVFGKRSEVRDAHDRYANIEVSYLLQKMEEYQGIVILATNFRKNIDDAFVRRLHFSVEFPFPEEKYRLQIWQRVFPVEAPQSDSLNLHFLARQFKLSGGNIKNIAVASAFLAAQDEAPIGMDQIVRAVKREYQKMGKLVLENDFGAYFDLVKT
jgi:SpoVK/Ycf46/Vps4 family AAA+-type ATPase